MRWMGLMLAMIAICLGSVAASAAWTASVSGRVVDVKTLLPVADATIRIYTERGYDVMGKATSDAQGNFVIEGLRGGTYRLEFEKRGYQRTLELGLFIRPAERLIEAAPIAMYPDGVKVPRPASVSDPCGSLVQPGETSDVYVICSGD